MIQEKVFKNMTKFCVSLEMVIPMKSICEEYEVTHDIMICYIRHGFLPCV